MSINSKSRLAALRQQRSASSPRLHWRGVVILAVISAGILCALYFATHSLLTTFCIVVGFFALCWYSGVRHSRRIALLVASRSGESICGFARSFSRRSIDTLLLRAVYESVQQQLGDGRVPIRASDRLLSDLRLDSDDIDEIYWDVAETCGYDTEGGEQNPFRGRVETVAELVYFIQHQPRKV